MLPLSGQLHFHWHQYELPSNELEPIKSFKHEGWKRREVVKVNATGY